MKIHPGSVVAQSPHSAIIYDELVCICSHLKTGADNGLLSGFHNPDLCTGSFSCDQDRGFQCVWFYIQWLLVRYCGDQTTEFLYNSGMVGVSRVYNCWLLHGLIGFSLEGVKGWEYTGSPCGEGEMKGDCKDFVFWFIVLYPCSIKLR